MEDDNELWKQASADFQPLKNKRPKRIDKDAAIQKKRIKVQTITPTLTPPPPYKSRGEFIETGDTSQIDGSIARKLKEGSYPIDATLDLHGRTQDEAFETLRYFIATAYDMGKRCVLVITGKGVEGQGILREQLPKWLSTDGLRGYILTIHHANAKHGGGGAFYVLLKKRR
jgi:DNA-nicking Smr family endonuclease